VCTVSKIIVKSYASILKQKYPSIILIWKWLKIWYKKSWKLLNCKLFQNVSSKKKFVFHALFGLLLCTKLVFHYKLKYTFCRFLLLQSPFSTCNIILCNKFGILHMLPEINLQVQNQRIKFFYTRVHFPTLLWDFFSIWCCINWIFSSLFWTWHWMWVGKFIRKNSNGKRLKFDHFWLATYNRFLGKTHQLFRSKAAGVFVNLQKISSHFLQLFPQ
jgi:hypothetical protein